MSWTAMWNNRNVRTCAGNDFSCSRTTGYGIPSGYCEYHSCRVFRLPHPPGMLFLKPEQYGKIMTCEQAAQLDRESGRSVPYGRNICKFVMSRAARKRGYTTKDFRYIGTAKRYGTAAVREQQKIDMGL